MLPWQHYLEDEIISSYYNIGKIIDIINFHYTCTVALLSELYTVLARMQHLVLVLL